MREYITCWTQSTSNYEKCSIHVHVPPSDSIHVIDLLEDCLEVYKLCHVAWFWGKFKVSDKKFTCRSILYLSFLISFSLLPDQTRSAKERKVWGSLTPSHSTINSERENMAEKHFTGCSDVKFFISIFIIVHNVSIELLLWISNIVEIKKELNCPLVSGYDTIKLDTRWLCVVEWVGK